MPSRSYYAYTATPMVVIGEWLVCRLRSVLNYTKGSNSVLGHNAGRALRQIIFYQYAVVVNATRRHPEQWSGTAISCGQEGILVLVNERHIWYYI